MRWPQRQTLGTGRQEALCYNRGVRKFLDLKTNLRKLLWVLGITGGLFAGAYALLFHCPKLLFDFPAPNGKQESIFFRASAAVKQGIQSGLIGHLYVPESQSTPLAPYIQNSRFIPGFFKNWWKNKIETTVYKYYERDFSDSNVEARGMGALKVVKAERDSDGYRLSVLCETPSNSKSEVEVSIKRGNEVLFADSFAFKCEKANDVGVSVHAAEGDRRELAANASGVTPVKVGDELEVRFWFRVKDRDGARYLSGDEGFQLSDPAGTLALVKQGTVETSCRGDASAKCQVPAVTLKAERPGLSSPLMYGQTVVPLPVRVIAGSSDMAP